MLTYNIREMLGRFKVVVSIDNNKKNPWIIKDVFKTQSSI